MTKIAIVGRPNVGKSALFNRLSGRRHAIVNEEEGVTRDRLYSSAEFFGRPLTLIDTGGIDSRSTAPFQEEICAQAQMAMAEADGLIFVVDGEVGLTDLDADLARLLQKVQQPVVVAVNKIDGFTHEHRIHSFHALGLAPLFGISALHSRNVVEMVDYLLNQVPSSPAPTTDCALDVALIGRPNVGKSTLLNGWLGEQRSIVSPIAGTTRDQIDAVFSHRNQKVRIIDTAGIRKKQAERVVVDKFAAVRTQQAIRDSHVSVLLCDAQVGITSFEKRIATSIEKAGKGCVVVLNKWDLIKGFRMEHAARQVRHSNPFLAHCPLIFASAKTGRNRAAIIEAVYDVATRSGQKIKTGALNTFLEQTMQRLHPPMITGKRLRVYYMTQTGNFPMRFVLFVNHPRLMAPSYHKYLLNQFRETFGCQGIPILFQLRGKSRRV